MKSQIKGPGIFLAQFTGDEAPFNSLESITKWAASLGYIGVQIPTFDTRLFDLDRAAESTTYCDEVQGICADAGVEITELSTHLQGQLVAVNPAYDIAFDAFAPAACQKNPAKRQAWAVDQMKKAVIDAVIRDPDLDVEALNYHLESVGLRGAIEDLTGEDMKSRLPFDPYALAPERAGAHLEELLGLVDGKSGLFSKTRTSRI